MNKKTFYLHIKECEFRYNLRKQNLYLFLLNELRKNKLN
jgi:transposase